MFAQRMSYLESPGIRTMFEMAGKMKRPIDLSLSQADHDMPEPVKKAVMRAISEGKNGYTAAAGIPEVRRVLLEDLRAGGMEAEDVMVTAGATGGLMLSLLALADSSVEVLVSDPCFVTYGHLIRMSGATPRWIDTYPDFRLTPERLEAAATPKSRILLFNSPVNPTGVSYTAEEIKALAQTARRLGLRVISDEVYDKFCFDHPHESWLKHDPNTILLQTFSKPWGMAGWRLGFAAGPRTILEKMAMLQQLTFVCGNAPAQWACIEGLKAKLPDYRKIYRRKRDYVLEGLGQEFSFHRPEGAFFLFPKYPGGNGKRFMEECFKSEILVTPGKMFSSRDTHFRLSFSASDETLKRGVDALVGLARRLSL